MMNDTVLPREHGFPVRILIPDRYGMKNAKWIVNLKPMTQGYVDWYGQRNWSQTGTVKTMSRIDVPGPGAKLAAGQSQIAGIAYGRDAFVRWIGAPKPTPSTCPNPTVAPAGTQSPCLLEVMRYPQRWC